jgi:membrane protease subunit HflC
MAYNRGRKGAVATVLMVAIVVLLLLAWMFLFKVDFTEYVIVRTFGKTTAVMDGTKKDAGLHVRWPFVQEIVRYDARTFDFEDAANELVTRDHQNITLTTFCAWRINDPLTFQTAVRDISGGGEAKAGQELIRTKLRSAKGSVIGQHNMADLVNTEASRMQITQIEKQLKDALAAEVLRDYGVEVTMVGIKTLGLPENVSEKVIASMKAERQREAQNYESAGQAQAMAIRERAKESAEQILAFANRKAGEVRAEGDAAAAVQYAKFEANWQLAAFLRSLESLKKELQGRSIFLLDAGTIPAVGYFRHGPSLPKAGTMDTPAPMGPAPAGKAPAADAAKGPADNNVPKAPTGRGN